MKKTLAALLAITTVLTVMLTSCQVNLGNKSDTTDAVSGAGSQNTEAVSENESQSHSDSQDTEANGTEEIDRVNYKDGLPEDLDFKGRE